MHGDWLLDDEAIFDELSDGLAGVGIADLVRLVRVQPSEPVSQLFLNLHRSITTYQILRLPQPTTDAARRFWVLRLTLKNLMSASWSCRDR